MKRTATIVALLITIILASVAYAQSTVWLPVAISDNEQQISAASLLMLNNGDTVRCASGSPLSFAWSADHRTGTARCTGSTPTATGVPPTATPVAPTNTPAPPTATPGSGGTIQPYASAKECPTHDDTKWHGAWDFVRGCWYDHEHGDDPALANDLFGPLGVQWQNAPTMMGYHYSSIMPPWGMANEFGPAHGGWKVRVYRDLPGRPAQCWLYSGDCVIATRILTHFGPKGGQQPDHTFWLEAIVQNSQGQRGIVRTGGTWKTGILHSPYKAQWVKLPTDPPYAGLQFRPGADPLIDGLPNPSLSVDPYRAHSDCASVLRYAELFQSTTAEKTLDPNRIGWRNNHFWIMHDNLPAPDGGRIYGMTPFVHLGMNTGDASSCVEGNGAGLVREPFLGEIIPDCALGAATIGGGNIIQCRYNNSNGPILFDLDLNLGESWVAWMDNSQWDNNKATGTMRINTYMMPQLRNPDGSEIAGRPAARRFFDEASGCTTADMLCVPFIVEDAPTGIYNWTTPVGSGYWEPVDFDLAPPGVHWLSTKN